MATAKPPVKIPLIALEQAPPSLLETLSVPKFVELPVVAIVT